MAGVEHALKSMESLGELVCDITDLVKAGGVDLGTFSKLLEVLADVRELVGEATPAMPELQDLDASEVGQLSAQAYTVVKKVLDRVAA